MQPPLEPAARTRPVPATDRATPAAAWRNRYQPNRETDRAFVTPRRACRRAGGACRNTPAPRFRLFAAKRDDGVQGVRSDRRPRREHQPRQRYRRRSCRQRPSAPKQGSRGNSAPGSRLGRLSKLPMKDPQLLPPNRLRPPSEASPGRRNRPRGQSPLRQVPVRPDHRAARPWGAVWHRATGPHRVRRCHPERGWEQGAAGMRCQANVPAKPSPRDRSLSSVYRPSSKAPCQRQTVSKHLLALDKCGNQRCPVERSAQVPSRYPPQCGRGRRSNSQPA